MTKEQFAINSRHVTVYGGGWKIKEGSMRIAVTEVEKEVAFRPTIYIDDLVGKRRIGFIMNPIHIITLNEWQLTLSHFFAVTTPGTTRHEITNELIQNLILENCLGIGFFLIDQQAHCHMICEAAGPRIDLKSHEVRTMNLNLNGPELPDFDYVSHFFEPYNSPALAAI